MKQDYFLALLEKSVFSPLSPQMQDLTMKHAKTAITHIIQFWLQITQISP